MHPHLFRRALLLFALACIAVEVRAGAVNINSADAATIAHELKGIGLKRAQAIVDYRTKHGPFKSAEELALVKGIGHHAIDTNRNDIRLDSTKMLAKPVAAPPAAASAAAVRKATTLAH